VQAIARDLARSGVPSIDAFLRFLDLENEDACGLCAQAPEHFTELAVGEWRRLGVRYEISPWHE
jgi:hypothetical protein